MQKWPVRKPPSLDRPQPGTVVHMPTVPWPAGVACPDLPAIDATGRARLRHHHRGQERETRFQPSPDPDGDPLAGRVLETRKFVEIPVIQPLPDRLERSGNLRVIHQPTQSGVAFARDNNLDLEAMTVETPAFVRLREMGQSVRRFELENLA